MAVTVTNVVTGALILLEVRVAESAITADEAEEGRVSLNDMMAEWVVDGIDIGYEALDDSSDEIHVIAGSIGAMKAGLAVYIAPEYGRPVSAELQNRARRGKNSLRASVPLNSSEYPDTLPIGSGNEDNNFVGDGDAPGNLRSSKFYPSNTDPQCN